MQKPAIHTSQSESTQCRNAYEAIAPEYEDPSHGTIADFHRLTKSAFATEALALREAIGPMLDGHWLVAGVGPGSNITDLIETTDANPQIIHALDTSRRMLKLAKLSKIPFSRFIAADICEAAENGAAQYDVIVALLCDPYLNLQGLTALRDHVRPGGRMVVSVPTKTWATLVRPAARPNHSTFNLSAGGQVIAPSYCWDCGPLSEAAEKLGLATLYQHEITVSKADQLSAINTEALSKMPNGELPLISLLVFRRDAP